MLPGQSRLSTVPTRLSEMSPKPKNHLARFYTGILRLIAPLYRLAFKNIDKARRVASRQRIVLLVSKPQDIELLIGLHEIAGRRKDVFLCFWVTSNCARRYPMVLGQLREKKAVVEHVISFGGLGMVLRELMRTDVFLSTVESTAARHKLPYMVTRLANAAGVSTYTLQHGFENVGLSYCDEVHGPAIKFAAKTVLTWGPVEKLPPWVGKDTREKAIAVGCPKKLAILDNVPTVAKGDRPIIGVFDNLHWHRYDEKYLAAFLGDLEAIAVKRKEFRFVLKSHPDSVRNRNSRMLARLGHMQNVEVADLLEEEKETLTTPWLLSHALGVITTPSTVALDASLARVPTAVARYGLDLSYYSPLCLLDNPENWHSFLDRLTEQSGIRTLKLNGEQFLNQVIVSGDASARILNMMLGQQSNRDSDQA